MLMGIPLQSVSKLYYNNLGKIEHAETMKNVPMSPVIPRFPSVY